jgi:hypothetical protein
MAVLEETELIVNVLSQLFEHSDIWQKEDPGSFADLKDYLLFAVPKLIESFDAKSVIPSSLTE